MPDFGGDGVSLRGAAGKKLREQQEKDLKEFQDMLNDPLKLKEYLKREKDAKGGRAGFPKRKKMQKGGIARGCGKVMENRRKFTKVY
jgi:hypothetical protein